MANLRLLLLYSMDQGFCKRQGLGVQVHFVINAQAIRTTTKKGLST